MDATDVLHSSKCVGTYEICEQDEHKETKRQVRSASVAMCMPYLSQTPVVNVWSMTALACLTVATSIMLGRPINQRS
jgi:hypothetical protein